MNKRKNKKEKEAEKLATWIYGVIFTIALFFVGTITLELNRVDSAVGAILTSVLYFSLDSKITAKTKREK